MREWMNNMKTVILLSGKKETGKSTAAQILQKESFVEQSFAEELKNQLFVFTKYVLGASEITYNHFQDQKLKVLPIKIPYVDKEVTSRYIMQVYGTEVMRDLFNEYYWVDQVVTKIENSNEQRHCIVGMRFPNEIARVKSKLSGSCEIYSVRINRETGRVDNHPSEISLDDYKDWDYIIDNNYSMLSFEMNVHSIINNIFETLGGTWEQPYF